MLQCQATPISLNLTYNCDPRLLVIIIIILIEGLMSFMYNISQTKQSNLLLLMIMMMTIIIIIIIIIIITLFYTSKLLVYLCWFKSSRNYMSVLSLPNNLF